MKTWQFCMLLSVLLTIETAIRDLKPNPSAFHEWATLAITFASLFAMIVGLWILNDDRNP